jgi:hypothetical protein
MNSQNKKQVSSSIIGRIDFLIEEYDELHPSELIAIINKAREVLGDTASISMKPVGKSSVSLMFFGEYPI